MSLKPRHEGQINGFCVLNVTGLKGQVVKRSTTDNTIAIAASGEGDGLLAQKVYNFSGQYRTGYRDLATTDANVGDTVGFYWEGGSYESNIFIGTVSAGDTLYANASGYLESFASPGASDVPIAQVIEGGTANGGGDDNTTYILVDLLV